MLFNRSRSYLLRHVDRSFFRLMTTNEATGVYEDAAGNTDLLR